LPSSSPDQPHDSLFRTAFSRRALAVSFLRQFLPQPLVAQIDWTSLKVRSIPGIAASLDQNRQDLIYQLRWKSGVNLREICVFVLLEHQSKPERFMAFRVLEYAVLLWRYYQSQHKKLRALPLIFPVVVYLGRHAWKAPMRLQDLHDVPEGILEHFSDYLPECGYLLIDLGGGRSQEGLPENQLAAIVLELMQAAASGKIDRDMVKILRQLAAVKLTPQIELLLKQIGEYILRKSELSGEEIRGRLHSEINETLESTIMSTYDQLLVKIKEGRVEGRVETLQNNIIEVLELRFERVPAGLIEEIKTIAESEKLRILLRAAVTSNSIEDFAGNL
jgi:predicted transposase/invertase (TIGR01784 family)